MQNKDSESRMVSEIINTKYIQILNRKPIPQKHNNILRLTDRTRTGCAWMTGVKQSASCSRPLSSIRSFVDTTKKWSRLQGSLPEVFPHL